MGMLTDGTEPAPGDIAHSPKGARRWAGTYDGKRSQDLAVAPGVLPEPLNHLFCAEEMRVAQEGPENLSLGEDGAPIRPVQSTRSSPLTVLDRMDWLGIGSRLGLSSQEVQVVRHIFLGKKLSAVAREMQLGLGTVKTYSQRVYRKLGVADRQALTLAVVSAHLQMAHSVL